MCFFQLWVQFRSSFQRLQKFVQCFTPQIFMIYLGCRFLNIWLCFYSRLWKILCSKQAYLGTTFVHHTIFSVFDYFSSRTFRALHYKIVCMLVFDWLRTLIFAWKRTEIFYWTTYETLRVCLAFYCRWLMWLALLLLLISFKRSSCKILWNLFRLKGSRMAILNLNLWLYCFACRCWWPRIIRNCKLTW